VTHYVSAAVKEVLSPAPKKRGRPKGKPSLAVALTHELINKKAENVVKKVLQIALDDKHPKQLDALKMCFDRLAPMSVFERAAEHQKNKGIEININVVSPNGNTATPVIVATPSDGGGRDEVVDVEATEVTREQS
jgi:leucyl-tRNA synthetase